MAFTFRCVIYVSAATTVYFVVNFNDGTGNIGAIVHSYDTQE